MMGEAGEDDRFMGEESSLCWDDYGSRDEDQVRATQIYQKIFKVISRDHCGRSIF